MITQGELKKLLTYEPGTGLFKWNYWGAGISLNGIAGSPNQHGQILICINYKRYLASRLAWLYVYGEPIPKEIDHINGNCSDNRLINLREATHSQNLANSKTRWDNSSGEKGVCWDKQKDKWKVQVGPAGKRVQKHFVKFEDAVVFAREKRKEIFGEFAR